MNKTFLFEFAVTFCVVTCVISAKEADANDVARDQPEILHFMSVDSPEVKGLHANVSELTVARANECINGKWMRKCDIKETKPCTDETKVCVCHPEFAETEPNACKYCNCGQGFNCTYKWYLYDWKKNCICPEGYYQDRYSGKCTIECNEEQPCRNGGTCSNKVCSCPYGTSGVLCEEIRDCSSCANRLEVDCLYDQRAEMSYCSCKNLSLYYDYGRDICIPCPCGNGWCSYEMNFFSRKLKCDCYSGYKEYRGYCKECDCGPGGYCELDPKGNKICHCKDGYYEREGHCNRCECGSSNKCEVTGNEKLCFCNPGFQFVLGHCEDINECETNNTCPPETICYNTFGSFDCQCPDGYVKELIYDGPRDTEKTSTLDLGFVCEDINECKKKVNACYYARDATCVNLPGSYKCECKPGYEPFNNKVQPHETSCIKAQTSWGPALIVIFTTCALLMVSYFMHICVRKRSARSY